MLRAGSLAFVVVAVALEGLRVHRRGLNSIQATIQGLDGVLTKGRLGFISCLGPKFEKDQYYSLICRRF